MKTFALTALSVVFLMAPGQGVLAGSMEDVCHARAKTNSGYDGRRKGLTKQVGNVKMRLSGTIALGVSRSSGPSSNTSPAFAGQASIDRREEQAKSKYTRIYNDCMQNH